MSGPEPAPYPIIARLPLEGPRGLVGRNRERLKGIPNERTGIGLVLEVDGVHSEVPNGTPLRRAPGIGSASGVILVDLRPRLISVDLTLPSSAPHRDFAATATFQCQVRDATAVVEDQIGDVAEGLARWASSLVRGISRDLSPEDPAVLEDLGSDQLTRAVSHRPLHRATVVAIKLATFEVEFSSHQREELTEWDARVREADAKVHQVELDERVSFAEDAAQLTRDDRKGSLRDRRAERYAKALAQGPEALMALVLADNPEAITQIMNRQLDDRNALYHFLVEVTNSPHIDGSVMEPYAKRLVELFGQELKLGPGFSLPEALEEGASWAGEEFDDGAPDPGAAPATETDPFDRDAVLPGEVIDTAASPATTGGPAERGDEPPSSGATDGAPATPPGGDLP